MIDKPLVSTAWLAEHLGQPGLLVFDATLYLPTEGKNAPAEFRRAHIPGTRFFDVDAIADDETDLPHMVPTPARFARLVGELGVSNDSTVVFYDQKGLATAPRGWWMMGLFGHDRAAVLDGGLPKWIAEGRPVESGESAPAVPASFRADFRATRLRGIGDVLANVVSHNELVLDARAGPRFCAEVAEPRPGMRAGHIPGSRNLPFTELLAPDQTMLAPDQLRARLAAAGVDGKLPVVTSCGSGVTATVLTLAMTLAGLPAGAVYDGSWSEWGGRADTPVET
jgi:thiosulfate/3-mercaptopyruvate sulfurtransferase